MNVSDLCKHCHRCKDGACDVCACCGRCQKCGQLAAPTITQPPVYVPYPVYPAPQVQPWPPPLGPEIWWGDQIMGAGDRTACAPTPFAGQQVWIGEMLPNLGTH